GEPRRGAGAQRSAPRAIPLPGSPLDPRGVRLPARLSRARRLPEPRRPVARSALPGARRLRDPRDGRAASRRAGPERGAPGRHVRRGQALPGGPVAMSKIRRPIVIEHVRPAVDDGRYPVKRVAGATLTVTADIFKEGHDLLAASIRFRAAGDGD